MNGTAAARSAEEEIRSRVGKLAFAGIKPCLGIVRVGARPDDLSYERSAAKRMSRLGIGLEVLELPADITQSAFNRAFEAFNKRADIHGILLFRPLPVPLSADYAARVIAPFKDVDCMNLLNMADVFTGEDDSRAPCTPSAVIELLEYYGVALKDRKVTVIGRSLVFGKPFAMMAIRRNAASITICHTKTVDLKEACVNADILVAAAGVSGLVTEDMVAEGAVVADVGINRTMDGRIVVDVSFDHVEPKASYITPVPGGVGAVTASVMARRVLDGAEFTRNTK